MTLNYELCNAVMRTHPYPLLFATVSGAHLYGFPSPDSDYDLRGVHLLPAAELFSLDAPRETIESAGIVEGVEIDLVTHDAAKFIRLMLRNNGYVLEQLLSPLIVQTSPEHAELCTLAAGCLTRHHAHHYLGFAQTQWDLFRKEQPPRVKPLLYVYRVLLTGIHLMRAGVVEANLLRLNVCFALPYIDELVGRKVQGREGTALTDVDAAFHEGEYLRLRSELEQAKADTPLPERPSCREELSQFLVKLRMRTMPALYARPS